MRRTPSPKSRGASGTSAEGGAEQRFLDELLGLVEVTEPADRVAVEAGADPAYRLVEVQRDVGDETQGGRGVAVKGRGGRGKRLAEGDREVLRCRHWVPLPSG